MRQKPITLESIIITLYKTKYSEKCHENILNQVKDEFGRIFNL